MRGGAAILVSLLLLGAAAAAEEDRLAHFPEGPNWELVASFCTACHSGRLIAAQGMSRERWDSTLSWMSENHGMPPLEGEYRQMFLDYLAFAFGDRGAGAPRAPRPPGPPPRKNPFLPN
jgi:hypothetical protein